MHKYKEALGVDENNPRAKEGLQRAQKLQKQAEKRDYYKILDVKRYLFFPKNYKTKIKD